MDDAVFELNQVSFSYQGVHALTIPALKDITLQIRRGERIALLGANGSGKSTLLRLLDALCFPDNGTIKAFGSELSERAFAADEFNFAFRRRVGLVFQDPDVQLFNPTVLDELAFGPLQLGWPKGELVQRMEEVMAEFAIAHLKGRAPCRLSGGEKKRVALASIMIMQPEVLLLDEPTAALDPASQGAVIRMLAEWEDAECTLITSTHDLALVEAIADKVFVLDQGRLAAVGTPAQILADRALLRQTQLLRGA